MSAQKSNFHVLIAGGGISGLTLAASLEWAGISYTLLEGRDQIAPQVGASIGIFPNGARILAQIGCFDELLAGTSPVDTGYNRYADGTLISPPNDGMRLFKSRFGAPVCFTDRQVLLDILYRSIKDRSCIKLNKRLDRVDVSDSKVTVTCRDGSVHHGHVLVGCDGVNSQVRHEMWRLADEQSPGSVPASDRTVMTAEYKCMYGISGTTSGLSDPGTFAACYGEDRTALYIVSKTAKGEKVYWFMVEKLDRVYKTSEIPQYTKEDTERFAKEVADWKLTPITTFGDLFQNVESHTLVCLEEAHYQQWAYDRLVCCGDSMHKVTPNAGAGGNAAIESAAAIANELKRLVDGLVGIPSADELQKALQKYQDIRRDRSVAICKSANDLTRIHALKTPLDKLMAYHVVPRAGDVLFDMISDMQVGAVMLDYLPPPKWSTQAYCPFNPKAGTGMRESIMKRLLLALPLLFMSIVAIKIMDPKPILPSLIAMDRTRLFKHGEFSFHIRNSFWGLTAFDNIVRPLTICFLPSNFGLDVASRAQVWSFVCDIGPLYTIMLIESARRANTLTAWSVVAIPAMAAQVLSSAATMPLLFYIVYATSQIDNFKSLDL
ncbi:hypothetical protein ANO11243_091330 [Dothideomycetidae sp. 11243]|nr:hypothetical protein ANO11243_091330 [fungal sp. No.11243]